MSLSSVSHVGSLGENHSIIVVQSTIIIRYRVPLALYLVSSTFHIPYTMPSRPCNSISVSEKRP